MKKVIEIFRTREELDRLVNTPNTKYKSGIRNRAILAVLCYAGLRVSELINLKLSDIQKKDSAIRINNTKKESSRIVYVPDYLFHYIEKWRDIRPNSKYLFCSRTGKKIIPDYIQKMVKRYSKRIAPDKDIHPHCLRHSIAALWLKEGKTIRGIQKQLGHKNLNTTQIYLDYFNEDRKKEFGEDIGNFEIDAKLAALYKEINNIKESLKV